MKTHELKPCPFCGGEAEIFEIEVNSFFEERMIVGCKACRVQLEAERRQIQRVKIYRSGQRRYIPTGVYTTESAIQLWNRRAGDENA